MCVLSWEHFIAFTRRMEVLLVAYFFRMYSPQSSHKSFGINWMATVSTKCTTMTMPLTRLVTFAVGDYKSLNLLPTDIFKSPHTAKPFCVSCTKCGQVCCMKVLKLIFAVLQMQHYGSHNLGQIKLCPFFPVIMF